VDESSGQVICETPVAVDESGGVAARRTPASTLAARIHEGASRLAVESEEVVVDCRALEQLGGAPLRVLVALAAEIESRGGRLVLEDAAPVLMRIIALGGPAAAKPPQI
jgi:hypothetical protein